MKKIMLILFCLMSVTLSVVAVDLGSINQAHPLDFEVPSLGQSIEYSFIPSTGSLAHEHITMTLKHEIINLPHNTTAEVLTMLAARDTKQPVIIATFSVDNTRKRFSDMLHSATFLINTDGSFVIKHTMPSPHEIDVVGKLSKQLAQTDQERPL